MKFTDIQIVLMGHLVSTEIAKITRRHKEEKQGNRFTRISVAYLNDLLELEEKLRENRSD